MSSSWPKPSRCHDWRRLPKTNSPSTICGPGRVAALVVVVVAAAAAASTTPPPPPRLPPSVGAGRHRHRGCYVRCGRRVSRDDVGNPCRGCVVVSVFDVAAYCAALILLLALTSELAARRSSSSPVAVSVLSLVLVLVVATIMATVVAPWLRPLLARPPCRWSLVLAAIGSMGLAVVAVALVLALVLRVGLCEVGFACQWPSSSPVVVGVGISVGLLVVARALAALASSASRAPSSLPSSSSSPPSLLLSPSSLPLLVCVALNSVVCHWRRDWRCQCIRELVWVCLKTRFAKNSWAPTNVLKCGASSGNTGWLGPVFLGCRASICNSCV